LFRSSHTDPNISQTSSYLDLSPLYGSCQKEQELVRTFVDGKLMPDTFSEERILGFPPGVSGLLISFNRFHNYVVGELAAINESGRFSKPVLDNIEKKVLATMRPPASQEDIKKEVQKQYDAAVAKRDNDLFQTGRL
jgi:linoleate 8R-lipoxygenase / 9,12-octadecadienoate 8-hydroperoxide 8R-isomerase